MSDGDLLIGYLGVYNHNALIPEVELTDVSVKKLFITGKEKLKEAK